MKYKILENEDGGLSVYLPYSNLFDETYNPDGYEKFPDIEIAFKDTEDKDKPSTEQIKALEYLLQHSFELSNFISEYIFNEREVLLEKGFQIEEIKEPKKHYRFSTIYIDDDYRDDLSYIGMTGVCSWDEEHGFGVVLFKKEIIDFGDWNCGYTMYSRNKEENFSLADDNSLESLTERRKKLTDLSENIEINNADNYISLLKWLIDLKAIYGYRNTKLDLNNNEAIALIQSLEKLDFSNKSLEFLHENFDLLTNLKELDLSNNNLKELSIGLCNLDLQVLYLSYNQIAELPNWFNAFKNLTRLNLNNNKIYQVPEFVGNFEELTFLDLSHNNLSSLPNSYKNLTNLTYFSIGTNKFDLVPEVIKYFKRLQLLYLDNNNIKIIPEWIGEFPLLRNLGLSNNKIIKLPLSIGNLKNLGELSLSNNELEKLPEEIYNLKENCKLYLKNNKLSYLPINVQKRKGIYILNNNISEEKLEEYLNWKEHYQNMSDNDFNTEISRIREEKRNGTYVEHKTSKSGCLGLITFCFILCFCLFIINN